jgi:hypothetical protein
MGGDPIIECCLLGGCRCRCCCLLLLLVGTAGPLSRQHSRIAMLPAGGVGVGRGCAGWGSEHWPPVLHLLSLAGPPAVLLRRQLRRGTRTWLFSALESRCSVAGWRHSIALCQGGTAPLNKYLYAAAVWRAA